MNYLKSAAIFMMVLIVSMPFAFAQAACPATIRIKDIKAYQEAQLLQDVPEEKAQIILRQAYATAFRAKSIALGISEDAANEFIVSVENTDDLAAAYHGLNILTEDYGYSPQDITNAIRANNLVNVVNDIRVAQEERAAEQLEREAEIQIIPPQPAVGFWQGLNDFFSDRWSSITGKQDYEVRLLQAERSMSRGHYESARIALIGARNSLSRTMENNQGSILFDEWKQELGEIETRLSQVESMVKEREKLMAEPEEARDIWDNYVTDAIAKGIPYKLEPTWIENYIKRHIESMDDLILLLDLMDDPAKYGVDNDFVFTTISMSGDFEPIRGLERARVRREVESLFGVPVPIRRPVLRRDTAKAEEWLNKEESDGEVHRETKQWLLDNLQHVSFEEFRRSLDELVDSVNPELEGERYGVLWDGSAGKGDKGFHKSKRWTYQLIKDRLTTKPAAETYSFDRSREIQIKQGIENFVIFEDATYSGEQLGYLIGTLLISWRDLKAKGIPKIKIVVPYATKEAIERVTRKHDHKAEITVITSTGRYDNSVEGRRVKIEGNIPTISGLVKQPGSPSETDIRLATDTDAPSLTYFDHKIPDYRSFPRDITDLIQHEVEPYKRADREYYKREIVEARGEIPDEKLAWDAIFNEVPREPTKEELVMRADLDVIIGKYREKIPKAKDITPRELASILGIIRKNMDFLSLSQLNEVYSYSEKIRSVIARRHGKALEEVERAGWVSLESTYPTSGMLSELDRMVRGVLGREHSLAEQRTKRRVVKLKRMVADLTGEAADIEAARIAEEEIAREAKEVAAIRKSAAEMIRDFLRRDEAPIEKARASIARAPAAGEEKGAFDTIVKISAIFLFGLSGLWYATSIAESLSRMGQEDTKKAIQTEVTTKEDGTVHVSDKLIEQIQQIRDVSDEDVAEEIEEEVPGASCGTGGSVGCSGTSEAAVEEALEEEVAEARAESARDVAEIVTGVVGLVKGLEAPPVAEEPSAEAPLAQRINYLVSTIGREGLRAAASAHDVRVRPTSWIRRVIRSRRGNVQPVISGDEQSRREQIKQFILEDSAKLREKFGFGYEMGEGDFTFDLSMLEVKLYNFINAPQFRELLERGLTEYAKETLSPRYREATAVLEVKDMEKVSTVADLLDKSEAEIGRAYAAYQGEKTGAFTSEADLLNFIKFFNSPGNEALKASLRNIGQRFRDERASLEGRLPVFTFTSGLIARDRLARDDFVHEMLHFYLKKDGISPYIDGYAGDQPQEEGLVTYLTQEFYGGTIIPYEKNMQYYNTGADFFRKVFNGEINVEELAEAEPVLDQEGQQLTEQTIAEGVDILVQQGFVQVRAVRICNEKPCSDCAWWNDHIDRIAGKYKLSAREKRRVEDVHWARSGLEYVANNDVPKAKDVLAKAEAEGWINTPLEKRIADYVREKIGEAEAEPARSIEELKSFVEVKLNNIERLINEDEISDADAELSDVEASLEEDGAYAQIKSEDKSAYDDFKDRLDILRGRITFIGGFALGGKPDAEKEEEASEIVSRISEETEVTVPGRRIISRKLLLLLLLGSVLLQAVVNSVGESGEFSVILPPEEIEETKEEYKKKAEETKEEVRKSPASSKTKREIIEAVDTGAIDVRFIPPEISSQIASGEVTPFFIKKEAAKEKVKASAVSTEKKTNLIKQIDRETVDTENIYYIWVNCQTAGGYCKERCEEDEAVFPGNTCPGNNMCCVKWRE